MKKFLILMAMALTTMVLWSCNDSLEAGPSLTVTVVSGTPATKSAKGIEGKSNQVDLGCTVALYNASTGALVTHGSAPDGENSVSISPAPSVACDVYALMNNQDYEWPANKTGLSSAALEVNINQTNIIGASNLDKDGNRYTVGTKQMEVKAYGLCNIINLSGTYNALASQVTIKAIRVKDCPKVIPFVEGSTTGEASESNNDYATDSDLIVFSGGNPVPFLVPADAEITLEAICERMNGDGILYEETYIITVPYEMNKRWGKDSEGESEEMARREAQFIIDGISRAANNTDVEKTKEDTRHVVIYDSLLNEISIAEVYTGGTNAIQINFDACEYKDWNSANMQYPRYSLKNGYQWDFEITWTGNPALEGSTITDTNGTQHSLASNGRILVSKEDLTLTADIEAAYSGDEPTTITLTATPLDQNNGNAPITANSSTLELTVIKYASTSTPSTKYYYTYDIKDIQGYISSDFKVQIWEVDVMHGNTETLKATLDRANPTARVESLYNYSEGKAYAKVKVTGNPQVTAKDKILVGYTDNTKSQPCFRGVNRMKYLLGGTSYSYTNDKAPNTTFKIPFSLEDFEIVARFNIGSSVYYTKYNKARKSIDFYTNITSYKNRLILSDVINYQREFKGTLGYIINPEYKETVYIFGEDDIIKNGHTPYGLGRVATPLQAYELKKGTFIEFENYEIPASMIGQNNYVNHPINKSTLWDKWTLQLLDVYGSHINPVWNTEKRQWFKFVCELNSGEWLDSYYSNNVQFWGQEGSGFGSGPNAQVGGPYINQDEPTDAVTSAVFWLASQYSVFSYNSNIDSIKKELIRWREIPIVVNDAIMTNQQYNIRLEYHISQH